MKKATQEWLRKADSDDQAAECLTREGRQLHDLVCFHCQQSAEKYLKAILEEQGRHIPKTHDLAKLLDLLLPFNSSLRSLRRGLMFLTDFAVDMRYPGNSASKRQAASALRWASRIRDACRTVLGARPRRRRKGP